MSRFFRNLLTVFLIFASQFVFANTNEIHLPLLITAHRIFTNAIIISHNPSYAVVEDDLGIVHIAESNLPPELQKQFGYSPEAAAQFLVSENEKKRLAREKFAAQQAAYNAYMASLCGTNRPVRLLELMDETTHGGMLCEILSGNILIRDVPASAMDFLKKERQLKNTIADYQSRVDNYQRQADAAANAVPSSVSAMGDPPFVNSAMNSAASQANNASNMAANAEAMQKKLAEMKDELIELESSAPAKTTVSAYPTGQFYGGNEIWICTGIAPAINVVRE